MDLDTRRNAATSCTSMRGSLKTSSVGSGARRLPTTGPVGLLIPIIFASCSERFSDVFITTPCRFRPAPTANLVSCATPRFPEHAGGAKPGGLEFPRLKQLSPGLSLSGNYCDSGAFHKRSGKGSGTHGESDSNVSGCRLSPLEKHPYLVSGRFVTLRSYQCKRRFGAPESEVTAR